MDKNAFETVITSKKRKMTLNLSEVWKFRDLISLFVERDFKTKYKQTVLGPLWFIIQPLFTTVIYTVIFGNLAGGITDESVPHLLFYMAGNVPWLFFSACVLNTSNTFVNNASVFGKVYFPRLTTPISVCITNMISFGIEFAMFLLFWAYYFLTGAPIEINAYAALLPILIVQLAILGMGIGVLVSAMTTKYRDLQMLVSFGVSAMMYVSPVIYAASSFKGRALYTIVMLNPVTPIIEIIRYGWLGSGEIPWTFWGISWGVTFAVLLFGIALFNKIEQNFMDTV